MSRLNFRRLATLAMTIIMCISCLTVSGAATEDNTVGVRVNGTLVEFPDQAPYVNSDNRTLIPVRFVAEALGACVDYSTRLRCYNNNRKRTNPLPSPCTIKSF